MACHKPSPAAEGGAGNTGDPDPDDLDSRTFQVDPEEVAQVRGMCPSSTCSRTSCATCVAAMRRKPLPASEEFAFRGPVKMCEPSWIRVRCGCGTKTAPAGGCTSEDCLLCQDTLKRRRERRVWERIGWQLDGRPLCYTTFTVPPRLRALLTKRQWHNWIRTLVKLLKAEYGLEFAVGSTHPTGNDLDQFHPHFNLLWVRARDKTGWLPKWRLRRLRAEWAGIMGAKAAVIHHKYASRTRKQRRWIGYVVRPFPGWSHWTGHRVRWYTVKGKLLRTPDKTPWVCEFCGVQIEFVGLADAPHCDFYTKLGLASIDPRGQSP